MESVLRVENLKYKNILKGITFSLKEKSFNILIGANGSGKTILVNCIRNILKYEGNIYLYNENLTLENQAQVGFFIEEDITLENNVFEELMQLLENIGIDKELAQKKIYDIFKKMDIIECLFKQEKELSTKEKILINFIFSIIHDPKLLIIDRCLDNLDENDKNKILNYLKSQKKMTTLFICTNNTYFNQKNNYLFLNDGKIVLSGTFDEVIKEEKIFLKCGSNLPFYVDLCNKLKSYELIDSIILDKEKLVNEIWK